LQSGSRVGSSLMAPSGVSASSGADDAAPSIRRENAGLFPLEGCAPSHPGSSAKSRSATPTRAGHTPARFAGRAGSACVTRTVPRGSALQIRSQVSSMQLTVAQAAPLPALEVCKGALWHPRRLHHGAAMCATPH
jgi:hypothetical protein